MWIHFRLSRAATQFLVKRMTEGYSSKQMAAYVAQVVDVYIAVAGNELTTFNRADKDCDKILYNNILNYVNSKRYNIDFAEAIEKRKHLLQPMLTILPLDNSTFEEVAKAFPTGDDVTEKVIRDFWQKYQKIKTECRNTFGPQYYKEIKIVKSGEYNDDEIILRICESTIKQRIDTNCYKAQKERKEKFNDEKIKAYEDKKSSWKMQGAPVCLLTFLFCGQPGKNFTSICVGNEKKEADLMIKGRSGRIAMRALKEGNIEQTY